MSGADLIALAESVAHEVGIAGELFVREETSSQAPWGEYASTDVYPASSESDTCPITLCLFEDDDKDITIGFGESYHEVWFLNPEERTTVVREFLFALMRGRYEEWRRTESGKHHSAYGLLTDEQGKVLYSDFGRASAAKLERRGYIRKAFQPY